MSNVERFGVIEGNGRSPHACTEDLHARIMDAIYDYAGIIPLASAIGVLELAKVDLIASQQDGA